MKVCYGPGEDFAIVFINHNAKCGRSFYFKIDQNNRFPVYFEYNSGSWL